ncbi:MAG: exonuclease SbcCD subunit D [Chloroflexi bacterium]|nr:exonuclease SbcCD subunit D [Chloroflexota bacterium]
MRLLHFADAHIDMANYGRHDPETGLPFRVLDFLKSLDTIVDTAIDEKVDLVIFAGDAYKDRTPAPTFQREWGRRLMRLSAAKIPTILLIGNHDVSPALGRAHALQEFETLQVPYLHVVARPQLLTPAELGFPVQVIGLPWVSRSGLMAALETGQTATSEIYAQIEDLLTQLVKGFLAAIDPTLPVILTAHASVQGATFGGERMVMLGTDLVLPGSLVKDDCLDYVALGHIHKPQNLNGPGPDPRDQTRDMHPPVIYPGSIERVDFGEAKDDKFFIMAEVQRGSTRVEWRQLKQVRPFLEGRIKLESTENVTEQLISALPPARKIKDAIVRLIVDYPRDYERLINEAEIRAHVAEAFEFQLVKRPQVETRVRLAEGQNIASLSPLELLEKYWQANHTDDAETETLQKLAQQILGTDGPLNI